MCNTEGRSPRRPAARSEALGAVGDWQHELEVQIVVICASTGWGDEGVERADEAGGAVERRGRGCDERGCRGAE
ncbi:hypothetical protein K439DRAFT_1637014 [Ramaria rubella]|nr:hypothetical protein K439DRAFT_1637014 [Ramaria rubella]